MERRTFISPIEVDGRLDHLGWTRKALLRIVEAMVSGRNDCTANDPSGAAGYMSWKEGTRRLREIGIENGLQRIDIDNAPYAIDLTRDLLFGVLNTNERTAQIGWPAPANATKKGPRTDKACRANGDLFDYIGMPTPNKDLPRPHRAGGRIIWLLCVYAAGYTVRAELSCPTEFEDGFITDYVERIVLFDGEGGDLAAIVGNGPDNSSDKGEEDTYDIPVKRKSR